MHILTYFLDTSNYTHSWHKGHSGGGYTHLHWSSTYVKNTSFRLFLFTRAIKPLFTNCLLWAKTDMRCLSHNHLLKHTYQCLHKWWLYSLRLILNLAQLEHLPWSWGTMIFIHQFILMGNHRTQLILYTWPQFIEQGPSGHWITLLARAFIRERHNKLQGVSFHEGEYPHICKLSWTITNCKCASQLLAGAHKPKDTVSFCSQFWIYREPKLGKIAKPQCWYCISPSIHSCGGIGKLHVLKFSDTSL